MNAGTLTLTCLMLLTGQVQQGTWYTNDGNFKIPISIQPHLRQEVKQMTLYVSKDRGKSWEQNSVIPPEQDGFIFHAPADGEYWFRVAVINRLGVQDPPSIEKAVETQKIFIDSLKPNVRIISAQRQGNEIVVRWEIQESNPDINSMKLRYRSSDPVAPLWSPPVPIKIAPIGEARIKVNNGSPLVFRLEIKDLAGNFHFDEATVPGEITQAGFQAPSSPQGNSGPNPIAVSSPANKGSTELPPLPPTGNTSTGKTPLPPILPGNQETMSNKPGSGMPLPPPLPPNQTVSWESNNSGPKPVPPDVAKQLPGGVTPNNGHSNVAASSVGQNETPPQALPPVQIVNNPEIVLQYELSGVGPAGIGSVELWLTKNDGQIWEPWLKDPTVSPSMRGGKYQRTLKLPGEGVYGLGMVVRNKAGRGKEPRNGETPEMRIEIDLTNPEAILYAPEADPQKRDGLIISWEAKDKNLGTNPITLEWSENRNGPWNTIQTNLPNTGKYAWQLPTGMPVYIYLRLRVRDKAGNEGIAVTDQPQLADMSEPEGRLIGINFTPSNKK